MREHRVKSTIAKELSLYVVLYSPVQMAADLPENYAKHADAFQFIKDVPTDWDESVALAGEVGDYIAIARKQRGSPDWFLGALTDETARSLTLKLAFLDPKAQYVAEIYRDGPEADWKARPYDLVIERRAVAAADTLDLKLAPGGGAAVRFKPSSKRGHRVKRLLLLGLLAAVTALDVRAGTPTNAMPTEDMERYRPAPYVRVQHPDWTKHATLYQVNLRQFTPEGTLAGRRKAAAAPQGPRRRHRLADADPPDRREEPQGQPGQPVFGPRLPRREPGVRHTRRPEAFRRAPRMASACT